MKKLFTIVLIGVSSVYAQDNAFIKGKITNPTGKTCYLTTYVEEEDGGMRQIALDSSEVKADGTFAMSLNIKEQTSCSFFDGNEQTSILLDSGDDLYLTLNTKMFDETITFSGKGSEKNNAIKNFALIRETILNKVYSYDITTTDTTEIYAYMDKAFADYKSLVLDYKKDIPELASTADSEIKSIDFTTKDIRASFVQEMVFNKKVAALIGTDAIDFEGVDLKGNKVKISSFKGKTIVIDFWATWCGPCKAEMPSFKELEVKYGKDINFVSVGLYCQKEGWEKMAADFGFENNMYLSKEEEKQIAPYDVKFIPRYIVIDKNMKVVDAHAPRPSSGKMQKYF